MIPVVIVIGLTLGSVSRLLPFAATAAILVIVAVLWGVLVGGPWGIVVAGVNVASGAALGALVAGLGVKLFHPPN